jgi:hypothetical protein
MASRIFTVRRPIKRIAKRQLELRERLWPDVEPERLWSRHTRDGYTTMPKAMPLMLSIMDDLAGQPVANTYLELWCRTYDESFVTLSKPREIAFHSGFYGQRAERTWRGRLKLLEELDFISLREGPSGPASYALLFNPYLVIRDHRQRGTPDLRADKYNALLERALEIGDESMSPKPVATLPAAPETPAAATAS